MTAFLETLKAVAGEFVFPLRTPSVVLQIAVIALLLSFALALMALPPNAFLVLIWILLLIAFVVVLPYFARGLMNYLESRARGRRPQVAGIEQFAWFENTWSLFPILLIAVVTWGMIRSLSIGSVAGFWLILATTITVLPATLCVLAITHSPLQSLNPLSLWKLLHRMGASYAVVPAVAGLLLALYWLLPGLPVLFEVAFLLYLGFALFGACGAAIRPFDILDDIEITPDETAGEERRRIQIDAQREKLLTHAYGFASRGNAAGAVDLLWSSSAGEGDPVAASDWYFVHMLKWEDNFAALKFAQNMIHDRLAAGDNVAAVKMILRCRMMDARFAPLSADIDAAVAAAEACNNADLARVLRSGR